MSSLISGYNRAKRIQALGRVQSVFPSWRAGVKGVPFGGVVRQWQRGTMGGSGRGAGHFLLAAGKSPRPKQSGMSSLTPVCLRNSIVLFIFLYYFIDFSPLT